MRFTAKEDDGSFSMVLSKKDIIEAFRKKIPKNHRILGVEGLGTKYHIDIRKKD